MGRTLLMAHQNMAECARLLKAVQFVINRQNRAAGIAKNMLNPVPYQAVHQSVGTSGPNGRSKGGCRNTSGGSDLGRIGQKFSHS